MLRRPIILLLPLLLLAGCLSYHAGPLPGEPEDGTFLEIDGDRIHYAEVRPEEGEPRATLVLIHGFGASLHEWDILLATLKASGYRAVAIDLLGHGWSSRPEGGDYSIEGQAALVLKVLDRLKISDFVAVGHSWGSAVALKVAVEAEERVSRIVLYNGMFYDDQQPVMFAWARAPLMGEVLFGAFYAERPDEKLAFGFYAPERFVTETTVEQIEALMKRPGTNAAALATIRAIRFADLEPRYREIQKPVLLLWGREDRVTPVGFGERMLHVLPDADLVVLPRCGHLPMVEVPRAASKALLRFMAESGS
jgi:pimeloyl-ACP methyl ester carboxylesterase